MRWWLTNKYSLAEIPRDPGTMTMVTAGTMGLQALGGLMGASGTIAQGRFQQQAADYRATQDVQNASQAFASGQRQALDKEQQTRLALSTLRAKGAASGVNLTSPSAVGLASSIGGRGAYQAALDLYNGQNTATGLLNQAAAERATGEAAEEGANYSALGTIASAGASMLNTYGQQYRMR